MFFGRFKEVKEIKEAINSNKFESIMIYGRRRVGKTEIIKQAIKDTNIITIHFECKKVSNSTNLYNLSLLVNSKLGLSDMVYNSFDALLDQVFKFSINYKIIFVIDEFSFLLNEDFSIESSLAVAIDKYKDESNLKLIISGSYISLMTKMIEYNSHCYGRFNCIIKVIPFNYLESSNFYPNYSNEDKIKMYSIFGGLPYFNSLINSSNTADENIINLIVKRDSIIEHEINEMVLMETNKIEYMNDIISLIGRGVHKYNDIASIIKQKKGARPDYLLLKLIDMNIIEKVVPINDKLNNKKVMYVFSDNIFDFYYKFIFNNYDSMLRDNPKLFFDEYIKEKMNNDYIPRKFENISKEFLRLKNINGEISPIIEEIGKYSFNDKANKQNREFDVVTKDKNGYISYECKYSNSVIDQRVIEEEERQVMELDIKFYKLGFISKNGFSGNIDNKKYNLYILDDFFNI